MAIDRRTFLSVAAVGVASGFTATSPVLRADGITRPKAIAFDAFPVFDPRPIFALAEKLFPGKGAELSAAWRTRQFEYQWLRTITGTYADFQQTTEDALIFAAEMLKLDLTPEKREQLTGAYRQMNVWPDAERPLLALKAAGIRLAFLSNATHAMLSDGVKRAGLDNVFERILSTDAIKTYKPDPRAYRMAIDALRLKKEEILFVPFAGWDAAGAKAFGYRTFWVNRLGLPAERLGVVPDGTGQSLNDLLRFVGLGHRLRAD